MDIFFSCVCGRVVREEDGRPTRCPACGLPLRIAVAAAEPVEVIPPPPLQLRAVEVPAPPCEPGLPRSSPPPLRTGWNRDNWEPRRSERDSFDFRIHRESWKLEKHWPQFLRYPLRALPLTVMMAVCWATLLALAPPDRWSAPQVVLHFPIMLMLIALFGYTMAFLQATYLAAQRGEAGFVAWPGRTRAKSAERDHRLFGIASLAWLRGGGLAILAFLAGPIVPAVVGFVFWYKSGDLVTVDWVILAQLFLFAAGYWGLVMLSVLKNGSPAGLNPATVVWLPRKYRVRTVLVAVLIAIPPVVQALLALEAITSLQVETGRWLQDVFLWTVQLSWSVMLIRWFGVRSNLREQS